MRQLILLMLVFIPDISQAAPRFIREHKQGWFWYDVKKDRSIKKPVSIPALKSTLKTSLQRAVASPTEENLVNYIAWQNKAAERAAKFSEMWQWVIWKHPELNYSIRHPTNYPGINLWRKLLHDQKTKLIKSLAKQYGLFFFFRSNCQFSRKFAPILYEFIKKYDFKVIPISLDGKGLAEFPNPKKDDGQAAKIHLKNIPALYIAQPDQLKIWPVSVGLITQDELINRLSKWAQQHNHKGKALL